MKLLLPFLTIMPLLISAQNTTIVWPDNALEPNPYGTTYFKQQDDYTLVQCRTVLTKN